MDEDSAAVKKSLRAAFFTRCLLDNVLLSRSMLILLFLIQRENIPLFSFSILEHVILSSRVMNGALGAAVGIFLPWVNLFNGS